MTTVEHLEIAWSNITKRKLRTTLTIIGIVIAITTIFALISIGNGLDKGIREEFEKIGTNRLYVMPKGSSITSLQNGLTETDVETLEALQEVLWVNPYLQEQTIIEYNNEKKKVTAWATKADNLAERWKDSSFHVSEGRLFKEEEKWSTIVGYKTATEMFKKEIQINENVYINGKRFRVVGIFEEIGNPEDDNVVELPLETAQELFQKEEQVSLIEIITKQGADLQETAKKATKVLERKRGDDLFEVITPDQLLTQFSTIISIINTVLGAIASISLIVGGIGIMNASYTSVLERRKEIGIMKAIGAQNKDIMLLFLAESSLLGLLGGGIGVLCGFGIAKMTQYAAEQSGFLFLKITFDPILMIGSILFALCFGMIAGYLPAREATKKQIIDALRKV